MDGYCTIIRRNNNNNFTEEEMIDVFVDIEIARKSIIFVGTLTSNFSKYIKLSHKNPNMCFSLDKQKN